MTSSPQSPLTEEEKAGIVLAVHSVFVKLRNLHHKIQPIFESYGFTAPSAGVVARDLSEKIEASIVQHCQSFSKGDGRWDLSREGTTWEVKVCKDSGLTINQSKKITGESYIVVNYRANAQVIKVWVLWSAEDHFFSPTRRNSNARALRPSAAAAHIQVLQSAQGAERFVSPSRAMAKAGLQKKRAKAL